MLALDEIGRNGLEAMSGAKREGELRVTFRQGERQPVGGEDWVPHLVVEFRDSGPGIPRGAGDMFQLARTTKPNHMGIGLAFARFVARRDGGRVEVTDSSPRGTVIEYVVPLALGGRERGR